MTLDNRERHNKGFYRFFGNFGLLWHTFKEQIVLKSLQVDQDNLHTKSSILNVDLNSPSFDSVGSKWPAHESIKHGYCLKSHYFNAVGCARLVTPFGVCK